MAKYILFLSALIYANLNCASDSSVWNKQDRVKLDFGQVIDHFNSGMSRQGQMYEQGLATQVVIFLVDKNEQHEKMKTDLMSLQERIIANQDTKLAIVDFLGYQILETSQTPRKEKKEMLQLIFDLDEYVSLAGINADNGRTFQKIGEKQVLMNFLDLAKTLEFCHGQNPPIILGDIDWDSVFLIGADPVLATWKWNIGIKDHDCSSSAPVHHCRAPESIASGSSRNVLLYTKESDVYALSILMGMVLFFDDKNGTAFRMADNPFAFYKKIIHDGWRPLAENHANFNPKLRELLNDGFANEPERRPTTTQFVQRLEEIVRDF